MSQSTYIYRVKLITLSETGQTMYSDTRNEFTVTIQAPNSSTGRMMVENQYGGPSRCLVSYAGEQK